MSAGAGGELGRGLTELTNQDSLGQPSASAVGGRSTNGFGVSRHLLTASAKHRSSISWTRTCGCAIQPQHTHCIIRPPMSLTLEQRSQELKVIMKMLWTKPLALNASSSVHERDFSKEIGNPYAPDWQKVTTENM